MNELLLDLINKYQGETKMATQREKSRKHIDAHEAEINPLKLMRTGRTITKKGKEPTSGSETKTNKTQDPQDN